MEIPEAVLGHIRVVALRTSRVCGALEREDLEQDLWIVAREGLERYVEGAGLNLRSFLCRRVDFAALDMMRKVAGRKECEPLPETFNLEGRDVEVTGSKAGGREKNVGVVHVARIVSGGEEDGD